MDWVILDRGVVWLVCGIARDHFEVMLVADTHIIVFSGEKEPLRDFSCAALDL